MILPYFSLCHFQENVRPFAFTALALTSYEGNKHARSTCEDCGVLFGTGF